MSIESKIVSLDAFREEACRRNKKEPFEGGQINKLIEIACIFATPIGLNTLNTPSGVVLHFRDPNLPERSNIMFSVEKIKKDSGMFLYRLGINGSYPPPRKGSKVSYDTCNFDTIIGQLNKYIEEYTNPEVYQVARSFKPLQLVVRK